MHYIAAIAVNQDVPKTEAVAAVWQPLGFYPSRRIVEQAAQAAADERNADAYTVFAETSNNPFHRRIIARLNKPN